MICAGTGHVNFRLLNSSTVKDNDLLWVNVQPESLVLPSVVQGHVRRRKIMGSKKKKSVTSEQEADKRM